MCTKTFYWNKLVMRAFLNLQRGRTNYTFREACSIKWGPPLRRSGLVPLTSYNGGTKRRPFLNVHTKWSESCLARHFLTYPCAMVGYCWLTAVTQIMKSVVWIHSSSVCFLSIFFPRTFVPRWTFEFMISQKPWKLK